MGFAVFIGVIVLAIMTVICNYFIRMNNSIKDILRWV